MGGCTCNAPLIGTITATTLGPLYYSGQCRTITLAPSDVRYLIVAGGGGIIYIYIYLSIYDMI